MYKIKHEITINSIENNSSKKLKLLNLDVTAIFHLK